MYVVEEFIDRLGLWTKSFRSFIKHWVTDAGVLVPTIRATCSEKCWEFWWLSCR